jgi:hypothetical protein
MLKSAFNNSDEENDDEHIVGRVPPRELRVFLEFGQEEFKLRSIGHCISTNAKAFNAPPEESRAQAE